MNDSKENHKELEEEKLKWLNYFSGLKQEKTIYEEVKNIIKNIPFEKLKKNKSRLAKMTIFEFKKELYSL